MRIGRSTVQCKVTLPRASSLRWGLVMPLLQRQYFRVHFTSSKTHKIRHVVITIVKCANVFGSQDRQICLKGPWWCAEMFFKHSCFSGCLSYFRSLSCGGISSSLSCSTYRVYSSPVNVPGKIWSSLAHCVLSTVSWDGSLSVLNLSDVSKRASSRWCQC